MTKRLDLVGQRFSRLVVTAGVGTKNGHSMWECLCDCGNTTFVSASTLRSLHTKSCGCLHTKHRHKMSKASKEYEAWHQMKKRCCNPRDKDYKNYGGRGITICSRWLDKDVGFVNFLEDMGEFPAGMTLDRKNNDGSYSKDNCRLATRREQANNRRGNKLITFHNETKTLSDWEESLGFNKGILKGRLNRGISETKAMSTPAVKRKRS